MVEVEGSPRLQTSCTLEATDGMAVRTHTPRVLKARRAIMELLIASHPQDCLSCVRAGDCELATLAARRSASASAATWAPSSSTRWTSAPRRSGATPTSACSAAAASPSATTCRAWARSTSPGAGSRTQVAPGFAVGLNVSECVYCGQCARVCPTGAIVERDQVDDVVAALADPDAVVVAQVAPAVPATLLEGHSKSEGVRVMLERLAAALKRVGFDAVFDTSFAADLTIMEEASELLDRVQNGGVLPMFTSCSPAWVNFVETHRPDLIPHLSTCKSPQQMAGALIREIYPKHADLARQAPGGRLRHAVHGQEVRGAGPGRRRLRAHDARARAPVGPLRHRVRALHRAGAARRAVRRGDRRRPALRRQRRRHGGRGRTAYMLAAGQELEGGPKVAEARGAEGVRRFTVTAGDAQLNLAVVNGLGRVKEAVDGLLAPEAGMHFVEVMSCPGGCVGGGGQPYDTDAQAVKERLERLYEVDRRSRTRRSHENADVQALYEELLGRPLGEVSHRLLHRTYTDRSPRRAAV